MSRDHVPWSVNRLITLCKKWDFRSDFADWEEEDGEPSLHRAIRRLDATFATWRDRHPPTWEPAEDQATERFHITDVAILLAEVTRLLRLEEKVVQALGPPFARQRWNKRTRQFEPDEGSPDDSVE